MEAFKDINIFISEKEIGSFLGYKYDEPKQEVSDIIRDEIIKSDSYIEPVVYYERIYIRHIEDDKVILENGVIFLGEFIAEKLKGCKYIIAAVTTLGHEVDRLTHEAFDRSDFLRGSIIDSVGTAAVGYANKVFWSKMIDGVKDGNLGITSMISPGNKGWKLSEQEKIFYCMGNDFSHVTLTDSFLMLPMKSTAAIYGFGENIGIGRYGHICNECSMRHCSYRLDNKV